MVSGYKEYRKMLFYWNVDYIINLFVKYIMQCSVKVNKNTFTSLLIHA
jgi:hypothetical protein